MSDKIRVTSDLYMLRFIYDHHGYTFVALTDLKAEIGWDVINVIKAVHTITNWGFANDQRFGVVKSKHGFTGSGICLDEKYATKWFFDNECLKLENMIDPYNKVA
jgi:hypothetical protein